MDMDTTERTMQLRLAAYISWAKTTDRSSRTAAARRASHHTRFLDMARQQHPDATEKQLAEIAAALKKAHYQELALRSAQARRIKRELTDQAKKRRAQAVLSQAGQAITAA